jgi:hypothetical protein
VMEFSSETAIMADMLLFVDRRAILPLIALENPVPTRHEQHSTLTLTILFEPHSIDPEKTTQKPKIYKKKYELSDIKHPSLEGFPNNACLLFAHAQTLTAADLLSPCACWYARNHWPY